MGGRRGLHRASLRGRIQPRNLSGLCERIFSRTIFTPREDGESLGRRAMSTASVIIVEDEGLVALDLKRRLERMGYSVAARASGGREAVEKARETAPDLVLMDIFLGEGLGRHPGGGNHPGETPRPRGV